MQLYLINVINLLVCFFRIVEITPDERSDSEIQIDDREATSSAAGV